MLVVQLAKALQDPKWKVRRDAAISLGKLGAGAACASDALALAASDESVDVRRSSLCALDKVAKVGGLPAAVVVTLGQVVLSDADLATRKLAAVALSRLGISARPAAEALREALLGLGAERDAGSADSPAGRRGVRGLVGRVLAQIAGAD
jgi:HEAT repeat protein